MLAGSNGLLLYGGEHRAVYHWSKPELTETWTAAARYHDLQPRDDFRLYIGQLMPT
jgi:hypothetical protein